MIILIRGDSLYINELTDTIVTNFIFYFNWF